MKLIFICPQLSTIAIRNGEKRKSKEEKQQDVVFQTLWVLLRNYLLKLLSELKVMVKQKLLKEKWDFSLFVSKKNKKTKSKLLPKIQCGSNGCTIL